VAVIKLMTKEILKKTFKIILNTPNRRKSRRMYHHFKVLGATFSLY